MSGCFRTSLEPNFVNVNVNASDSLHSLPGVLTLFQQGGVKCLLPSHLGLRMAKMGGANPSHSKTGGEKHT